MIGTELFWISRIFRRNTRLQKDWNWSSIFPQLIYHRTMTYHSAIHKAIFRLMKLDHLNPFKVIFANLFHTFIPALSGQKRPPSRSTHLFFSSRRRSDRFPVNVGLKHGTIWWKPPCGAPCGCFFLYIDKLSVTRCSSIALAENGCSKGGKKMAEIDLANLIETTWNNMFHDCSRLSN